MIKHWVITGDTHGKFHKFWTNEFPEGQALNRDDYVIICGDFGAVWDCNGVSNAEKYHTVIM